MEATARRQITSGKIEPRRPIPSVRTLCQTHGIARATATKAIHVLADEGLIRRVPGKGWFVTPEAERPQAGGRDQGTEERLAEGSKIMQVARSLRVIRRCRNGLAEVVTGY